MSMQQKIIETAKEWYPANSGIPQSLCHRAGFIDGGKWATEFLVEKACEWLRKFLKGPMGEGLAADIVNEFRKTMEE